MDGVSEHFKLSAEGRWIASFFFTFALTAHSLTCIWIIVATLETGPESWNARNSDLHASKKYLAGFYFSMSTVVAGNTAAETTVERLGALCIMFIGVLFVSFATGSFTNYIDKKDSRNEKY